MTLVLDFMYTSYLEYTAHFSQVLSGTQEAKRQNWTHVFRDSIEMSYESIWNLKKQTKKQQPQNTLCLSIYIYLLFHSFIHICPFICASELPKTPLGLLQFK